VATRTIRFSEPWKDHSTSVQYAVGAVVTLDASVARGLISAGMGRTVDRSGHPEPDPLPIYLRKTDAAAAYAAVFAVPSTFGDGATDATAAIQAALDAANTAGGGRVYVPDGTYLITTALTIGSNTHLELGPRATVKRNAAIDNMLRNKSNNTTGAYGQASNITVSGGTWDMNAAGFPSTVTGIATGHAEYVTIRDTTLRNCWGWHFIELNSTRHAIVRNVRFRDMDATTTGKEMLQLDLMVNAGAFPWFGPYDNTPCDDVLVEGCEFINGDRGIGSHSTAAGFPHTNIRIIGNHFDTMREEAIEAYDYARTVITGNTFTNCWKCVHLWADQACYDHVISGNVMENVKPADNGARAIQIGGGDLNRWIRKVLINNNIVRNVGRHGIGFDFCQDVVVSGNSVSECAIVGIWSFQSNRVTITGNTAHANVPDIQIGQNATTTTNTQDNVVIGNNCDGISVLTSDRAVVSNNIAATFANASSASPAATGAKFINNYIAGTWTP
jgi:parallel beta-helix repeat protein